MSQPRTVPMASNDRSAETILAVTHAWEEVLANRVYWAGAASGRF